MPRRTRRGNDEQSAAMDSAVPSESSPAIESSSEQPLGTDPQPTVDNQAASAEAPAKPPRARRGRRSASPPDSAETVASAVSVDPDAGAPDFIRVSQPAVGQPAAETPKPRRTRRPKSAAADSSIPQAETAPAAESSEPIDIAAQTSNAAAPTTVGEDDSNPRRRRRVGGRRSIAPPFVDAAPEGTASTEPESSDEAQSETGGRTRRSRRGGRRRRGGKDQAVAAEGQELVEGTAIAAESAPADTETAAPAQDSGSDESEGGRRSRRSRRGGRRRGKADGEEAAIGSVAGEAAPTPQAATTPELSMPVPRVRERFTAPPLVPSLADLGLAPVDLGIEARLDARAPAFEIDGQRYPAHLFFVNADAVVLGADEGLGSPETISSQIRRAASAGIHLHTCVVYLPLKNAYGERAFGPIDTAIRTILDADPNGRLVLRVQCVPTNFWARTHEDQMVRYQDGSTGDVTIASASFWSDAVDALAALLGRLAQPETPGYGRVFALHLDKGEWFYEPGAGYDYSPPNIAAFRGWLHERYQSEYALRAAWFDGRVNFNIAEAPPYEVSKEKRSDSVLYDRKRDRRYVDYVSYASSVVASVLCGLARAVKEISQGKLLVFIPYGYLFEFATRNDSGHQALGKILNCADVDVLTGPNSYISRAAGGVGGFASPVDSVRLHDKLWIVEDDTKTYLAPDDTPDTYNPKITGQQETVMVQRRNFYSALTHGCGLSWMDLWGQGWLDSDSLWDEIKQMLAVAEQMQGMDGLVQAAPEAAVMLDEASYAWVRGDAGGSQLQSGLIIKARDLLLRSGAAIGFYLQSDVALLPDSVKVVFFLNALQVTTEERQAIRDRLQRDGKTVVWLYAPGLFDENGVAPSEVSEIVGMPLKAQPWNSRIGTVFTDERHPIIERLHGGKRMGTEEVINPSYTVIDPQASVLGEYSQTGDASIAVKVAESGWRSIFIGEPHLTGELIRGILRYAGVHLYDIQDDIVYGRSDGLLVLHAPYTGQRALHLPSPAACYSLTEQRLIAQSSSSIRLFMRGRSTHILIWGDLEMISRRTGRTTDDLLASHAARPEREPRDQEGEGRGRGRGRGRYEAEAPEESVEYSHDSEYIVANEPAGVEIGFEQGADEDGPLNSALEEVLKAVVEEVYSSANPEFEADAAGSRSPAGADLLDAKREASRITEALLADLPAGEVLETLDEDSDIETINPEGVQGEQSDQPAGSRSSSRRRRWRRKQREAGQAAPSISVNEILGDLMPRRQKPEDE